MSLHWFPVLAREYPIVIPGLDPGIQAAWIAETKDFRFPSVRSERLDRLSFHFQRVDNRHPGEGWDPVWLQHFIIAALDSSLR